MRSYDAMIVDENYQSGTDRKCALRTRAEDINIYIYSGRDRGRY